MEKIYILWTFSEIDILLNIHFFSAKYKAIVTGQLAKLSINNSSFAIKWISYIPPLKWQIAAFKGVRAECWEMTVAPAQPVSSYHFVPQEAIVSRCKVQSALIPT